MSLNVRAQAFIAASCGVHHLVATLALMVLCGIGSAQVEQYKLVASDGNPGDALGSSAWYEGNCAVDGAYAIIGSAGHRHYSTSGSVYVFDVQTGQQTREIHTPYQEWEISGFGEEVALEGSIALIAARSKRTVHVYDIATGAELARLAPPSGLSEDLAFGMSLAISAPYAVVGAPGLLQCEVPGRAYIFDIATGDLLQTLQPAGNGKTDFFGVSLAADGDLAVIGAPNWYCAGLGRAYIYELSTGTQVRQYEGPGDYHWFGWSVDITGTRAIIGSYNTPLPNARAYIYDTTSNQPPIELSQGNGHWYTYFANSVSMKGGLAAVGAPGSGTRDDQPGQVYIFDSVSGQKLSTIAASDAAEPDAFGSRVVMNNGQLFVVAPGANGNEPKSGAVYLFSKPQPSATGVVMLGSASGLPMRGVTVSAISANTGVSTETITDDNGLYSLYLPQGEYYLMASFSYTDPGAGETVQELRAYAGKSKNGWKTYYLEDGSMNQIDIVFPWPVILQAGMWGSAGMDGKVGTWDEAFSFLTADPWNNGQKSGYMYYPDVPAFMVFRMPNESEAPGEGYDNEPWSNHTKNAAKLATWIQHDVAPELAKYVSPDYLASVQYSLVGHSMGGVIVRALALGGHPLKTYRIVSLDGVHGGTTSAVVRGLSLTERFMNGSDYNCSSPQPPDLQGWNTEWNRVRNGYRWLLYSCTWPPLGIVTPDASAFGVGRIWQVLGFPCFWTDDWVQGATEREISFGHSQSHDELCVLQEIGAFLNGEKLQPRCPPGAPAPEVGHDLGYLSGTIAAAGGGSSSEVTAPFDQNTAVYGRFILTGNDAEYAVKDALGNMIDEVNSAVDQLADDVSLHIFELQLPPADNMIVELVPGQEDASLDWNLYFSNDRRAVIEATPALVSGGNPVQLVGWLQDDLGNLLIGTAAGFQALVRLPASGTEVSVAMYDDGAHSDGAGGDGLYGANFSQTDIEGLYAVTLQASATIGSDETARTAVTQFGVLPSGAVLSAEPGESTPDANGDGRFDALVISYEVTLQRSGSFLLSGQLVDGLGGVVEQVSAALPDAPAGGHTLNLVVLGSGIVRNGTDGPWTLTKTTLSDVDNDSLPAATAPDHITLSYFAMDFEAPAAPIITGLSPSEGHRLDEDQIVLHGNSLADTVTVKFDGKPAQFEVIADDALWVTVPRLSSRHGPGGLRSTAPFTVDVEVATLWGSTIAPDAWTAVSLRKR